jgi:2-polyprenyl-6-methoxyphenol hydroxylase-like FAD-dependent oxidoreductase
MSSKTAAVVGAGIAGLSVAAALGKAGYDVRVFERSRQAREFGAALMLKHNSHAALQELGLTGALEQDGVRLQSAGIVDDFDNNILTRDLRSEWTVMVRRQTVHSMLLSAARDNGVEIIESAEVVDARPEGELTFSDGTVVKADLVIGADGRHSVVRDSLGLTAASFDLPTGATRAVFARAEQPRAMEYWSGPRRVGLAPCSEDLSVAFLLGPESARAGARVPLDVEYWAGAFPEIADVFDRVAASENVFHHVVNYVSCTTFTAGRVALIGDAAHAMPPDLGQGANLAIDLGRDLVDTLDNASDIEGGLLEWERVTRPRADMVQTMSLAYNFIGYQCPPSLVALRTKAIAAFARMPVGKSRWDYYWRGGHRKPGTSWMTQTGAS